MCLRKVQNASQPQIQALRRKTRDETTIAEDMSQSSMGDSSTFDVERDHSVSASTSDVYGRTPNKFNQYMELPMQSIHENREDSKTVESPQNSKNRKTPGHHPKSRSHLNPRNNKKNRTHGHQLSNSNGHVPSVSQTDDNNSNNGDNVNYKIQLKPFSPINNKQSNSRGLGGVITPVSMSSDNDRDHDDEKINDHRFRITGHNMTNGHNGHRNHSHMNDHSNGTLRNSNYDHISTLQNGGSNSHTNTLTKQNNHGGKHLPPSISSLSNRDSLSSSRETNQTSNTITTYNSTQNGPPVGASNTITVFNETGAPTNTNNNNLSTVVNGNNYSNHNGTSNGRSHTDELMNIDKDSGNGSGGSGDKRDRSRSIESSNKGHGKSKSRSRRHHSRGKSHRTRSRRDRDRDRHDRDRDRDKDRDKDRNRDRDKRRDKRDRERDSKDRDRDRNRTRDRRNGSNRTIEELRGLGKDELMDEIMRIYKENSKLEEAIKSKEEINNSLKRSNSSLKKTILDKQKELNNLKDENTELRSQIQRANRPIVAHGRATSLGRERTRRAISLTVGQKSNDYRHLPLLSRNKKDSLPLVDGDQQRPTLNFISNSNNNTNNTKNNNNNSNNPDNRNRIGSAGNSMDFKRNINRNRNSSLNDENMNNNQTNNNVNNFGTKSSNINVRFKGSVNNDNNNNNNINNEFRSLRRTNSGNNILKNSNITNGLIEPMTNNDTISQNNRQLRPQSPLSEIPLASPRSPKNLQKHFVVGGRTNLNGNIRPNGYK